ncbi:hypothetical protein F66182_6819 [Fusarium sp. NRRL 66182]|nr:hypothetical protein F66182_6819 [Fusarium sp. NRRL 66182]
MSQIPDNEGLQVNPDAEAARAPEVAPGYHKDGTYYSPPGYQQPPLQPQQQQRLPLGLGVWTFAALVALVTAIVVGAGVGGGLGAALASKSNEECAVATPVATSEPTECPTPNEGNSTANDTAPYVPRPASSVESLELKCPESKNEETKYKSNLGYDFRWWCGVNAPQGEEADGGGIVGDIAPIVAYTIQDCMNACGAMIQKDDRFDTGANCRSIVFSKFLQEEMENQGANCWLKNGTKQRGGNWGFRADHFAYAEIDD